MAFDFHKDRSIYFEYLRKATLNHVIPFIRERYDLPTKAKILEIGSGDGGVLKGFLEAGCQVYGVELNPTMYASAQRLLQKEMQEGLVHLIHKNIFDVDFEEELPVRFDLIVLKDVIEHIHHKPQLFELLKKILAPNGHVFFGFPPWQMPFGGHQQICQNSLLSKLPYYHLLPAFFYKSLLSSMGESEGTVRELLDIKQTGLSIERFEKLAKKSDFQITHQRFYLVNPIYEYKFRLKQRQQIPLVNHLPFLRNFLTTCAYYLVK
ncbi:methyltransferase domain-containing protein [Rapidithrix thailandica]|uniref:Methyltransferase domain-containing protein n=1 Tax=Rapidithrix thailandica TaxID=413964 RepID=A0AAW9S884_9BACT